MTTLGGLREILLLRCSYRVRRPLIDTPQDTRRRWAESIFTENEIEELFDPSSPNEFKKGNLRGPRNLWTLSGSVGIGQHTTINGVFKAQGNVRVGKYCAVGQYVALISANHRNDFPNQQVLMNRRFGFQLPMRTKGPVEIGHNVWVGDKAVVLSDVRVGHGAVIGAGAVVTRSVEPFTIVGGNPARPIRKRFHPNVARQLLDIAWWHWEDARIARNKVFFETAIPPESDIDLTSIIAD